jgi:hypothetical protein
MFDSLGRGSPASKLGAPRRVDDILRQGRDFLPARCIDENQAGA